MNQHDSRRGAGERLALLLQSMGEGVIGMAGDGRCTFVNAAGTAMHGLLEEKDTRVAQALAAWASAHIEDALWRCGDGAVAALSCVVSPMMLDGQAAGAVIVFHARVRRARTFQLSPT